MYRYEPESFDSVIGLIFYMDLVMLPILIFILYAGFCSMMEDLKKALQDWGWIKKHYED